MIQAKKHPKSAQQQPLRTMLTKVRVFLLFGGALLGISLAASWLLPEARAVTVSPIRIELSANPGQTVESSFKMFNEKAVNQSFRITFARFETKDETGEPSFVPGEGGLASWVNAPSTVVAPPREFYSVPFSITVPRDVDPGGYFAALFVSPVNPGEQADNTVALEGQVGTLLLFRVNGDFSKGETIVEYNTKDRKSFFTSLPVEFYYRFQNSGADRVLPLGDITIRNTFGRIAKIVNANQSAGNTLPQSIRRYNVAWITSGHGRNETSFGPIEYMPENLSWVQTLRWQWEHFALGRYTATLEVTVNNDSSRSYNEKVSFWVIPWQLLITAIGVLALFFMVVISIAVLIVLLIYRRKRRS